MIYKCDKCNHEINLPKDIEGKYCPTCGTALTRVDIGKKIVGLYKTLLASGKKDYDAILKEIASTLHMSITTVNQLVTKAALNNEIEKDGLIQEKYEDNILEIMNTNWDGKLKTIKEKLPEDCSYATICYCARKNRIKAAIERNEKKLETEDKIRSLIKTGASVDQIKAETGANNYTIEKILVKEIEKDKAIANPYITSENKVKVLEIVNSPDWDGRLKTIKEAIPDISFLEIHAIIAKNK